jgi:hypothetical protein
MAQGLRRAEDDRSAGGAGRGGRGHCRPGQHHCGLTITLAGQRQAIPAWAGPMNPALITVIALGVVLVVAWDGFCLRDLIRADPATVRYLGKGPWAIICLLSCPWGGLLYVIAGRGGFGRVLKGRG